MRLTSRGGLRRLPIGAALALSLLAGCGGSDDAEPEALGATATRPDDGSGAESTTPGGSAAASTTTSTAGSKTTTSAPAATVATTTSTTRPTSTTEPTPTTAPGPAPNPSPAPPTTAAPVQPGAVEGTLEVPEAWDVARAILEREDGSEVGFVEAEAATPFAFEDLGPGRYRLVSEVASGDGSGEEGAGTGATSTSRTPLFDIGPGARLRFACSDTCQPA